MPTAEVKWFDAKKGFGFLVNQDDVDVLVHYSAINDDGYRTLRTGQKVQYKEVQTDKGLSAEDVCQLK